MGHHPTIPPSTPSNQTALLSGEVVPVPLPNMEIALDDVVSLLSMAALVVEDSAALCSSSLRLAFLSISSARSCQSSSRSGLSKALSSSSSRRSLRACRSFKHCVEQSAHTWMPHTRARSTPACTCASPVSTKGGRGERWARGNGRCQGQPSRGMRGDERRLCLCGGGTCGSLKRLSIFSRHAASSGGHTCTQDRSAARAGARGGMWAWPCSRLLRASACGRGN